MRSIAAQRGLHSQTVRQLGLSIVRHDVKPGEAFPDEATLSAQLGISRTVLREAVKVLAAKGLIEVRPRTGTRVRPQRDWNLLDPDVLQWRYEASPDERLLRNLTEVRRLIEPPAAGMAALYATDEQVASTEAWYRRMLEEHLVDEALINADMGFHGAIPAATQNDLLQHLGKTISLTLRFSRTVTASVPGTSKASTPLHWAVYEAIRDRDPPAAEGAMRELLERTAEDIHRVLHATDDEETSK